MAQVALGDFILFATPEVLNMREVALLHRKEVFTSLAGDLEMIILRHSLPHHCDPNLSPHQVPAHEGHILPPDLAERGLNGVP